MSSMTFGQLVESQQDSKQSLELAIAADYKITFGKHKGMNLSMLMEQQSSYCGWLLDQETSKNENFNLTVNYLKLLNAKKNLDEATAAELDAVIAADQEMIDDMDKAEGGVMIDGVPAVEGEPVLISIDPATSEPTGNSEDLANGLLMGTVTDLLEQVNQGDLSFEFGETDIDTWFKLVKDNEAGIENFVIIETKHSKTSNNQRIKKVIHSMNNFKEMKGVLNA